MPACHGHLGSQRPVHRGICQSRARPTMWSMSLRGGMVGMWCSKGASILKHDCLLCVNWCVGMRRASVGSSPAAQRAPAAAWGLSVPEGVLHSARPRRGHAGGAWLHGAHGHGAQARLGNAGQGLDPSVQPAGLAPSSLAFSGGISLFASQSHAPLPRETPPSAMLLGSNSWCLWRK